jgi:hypothetical protein
MARKYTVSNQVIERNKKGGKARAKQFTTEYQTFAGNALKAKVGREYYRFIGRLGGCTYYQLHLLERAERAKSEAVKKHLLNLSERYEVPKGSKVLLGLFTPEVTKGKRKTHKQLEEYQYQRLGKIEGRFERNQAIRAARSEYDRKFIEQFHAGLPTLAV